MAGTKMTLRTYGANHKSIYWDDVEIIVDRQYLDSGNGLLIDLDPYTYVPDIGQLEVHFNGQHLLSGGGYEEIDERSILLDLGRYPGNYSDPALAGQAVRLNAGDEIHIRIWRLQYIEQQPPGGSSGLDLELLKRLEVEIIKARKYRDNDAPHIDLDARLDYIEQRAESKTMVFVLGKVKQGKVKMGLRFPYQGIVTAVHADCEAPGATETVIAIEKCSHQDFTSVPVWTNMLANSLVIEGGQRSSDTSQTPSVISVANVQKNDHYRLSIDSAGDGIEGLTVQLVVKVL
ncbi:hypothetical protein A7K91_08445 [Paenibacillus oryzae]|uniref:Uncharacterized protein n=1 Tax=Paenibacillus oryzae TaxID=1844972 RepID=A0A1A5YQ72_9BACL|nr:hypothetical protein [Paenibacillus oryzae]OBR67754.1 hypothetical protein A7K91_08445 [Paenibacillus oryzae]